MSETKRKLTQKEAIGALAEARRELLDAAGRMPVELRREACVGTWTVLELLAHLTGWDHANMKAAAEVMEGKLPSFFEHHDHDWKSYNAMLVETYRRDSFEQMREEARASGAQLVEVLRAVPEEAFNEDFGVRFKGWKVTIQRLVEAETEDERTHKRQVDELERSRRAPA